MVKYTGTKERKAFMKNIKIYLDGKAIDAKEGQSILDAAIAADYYIPHLCSHPDLPAQGGCHMCVCKIDGNDETVCACETKAKDGMHITTKSDELQKERKLSLELMLAGHPHDCSTCKRFGNCELQALMQYLGIAHARLNGIHKETSKINTNNPIFVREMERCIACGRCVRACRDLRGVGVLQYNKKGVETYIGTKGDKPFIDTDCRFCSACVEVCPTGSLTDAIGIFRTELPKYEALVPCSAECPAGTDIPSYIRFVNQGKYSEAVAVIREKLPFPHALGFVCNHKCETGCKHNALCDAVSVRELKRFAVEHDDKQVWKKEYLKKTKSTGKKVAIIGAGPCGLTAAYLLNRLGHNVTVYEKHKLPGGMMTAGMPEYRIPTDAVLAEVKLIEDAGVKILCNQKIESINELKNKFDAILVSVGTAKGKKLNYLKGADAKGVYSALELLRKSRFGEEIELGKTVNVIGGGDVAFDCASTLIRMGKKVNVICLEEGACKASADEREGAIAEGAVIYGSHSNEEIVVENGKVKGMRVHKIKSFSFGEGGALIEDAIPDSSYVIPCDNIVFAAGQAPDLGNEFGIELNKFGYPVDPATGKSGLNTSVKNVFTAGDIVTGTRFVIDAIQAGRKAASAMDKFLGGEGNIEFTLVKREINPCIGTIDNFSKIERQIPSVRKASERKKDFKASTNCLTEEQAKCESSRCLQCDLRREITRVKLWTEYKNY